MEKKNKNMVAVILKVYAIVNAIIGCIIGLSGLSGSYNEIFNMVYTIFLGACIVVSFGIYAFGEVVQLLQDIKDGTKGTIATVYKGNIIKNLIMDCQSYTKYRPNETTGGIFVSWRRKEELPTGA